MKNTIFALAAVSLLASSSTTTVTLAMPAPPSQPNTTAIAIASEASAHPASNSSTAASPLPISKFVPENKCAAGSVITTPAGATIVCPSSASPPQKTVGNLYWVLPFAAVTLGLGNGRVEALPLLALGLAGWEVFGGVGVLADGTFATGTTDVVFVNDTAGMGMPATTAQLNDPAIFTLGTKALATSAVAESNHSCSANGTLAMCADSDAGDDKKGGGWHFGGGGAGVSSSAAHDIGGGVLLWALALGSLFLALGRPQPVASLILLLFAGAWLQLGTGMPKVAAADMFVSITPGSGVLAPESTPTTSALLATTSTASLTLAPTIAATAIVTPHASATAESLASTYEILSGMLWLFSFGAVAALVAVGRMEALLLLLLLVAGWTNFGMPRVMGVGASATVTTTITTSSTTTRTTVVTLTGAPSDASNESSTSFPTPDHTSAANSSAAMSLTTGLPTTSANTWKSATLYKPGPNLLAHSQPSELYRSMVGSMTGVFTPAAIHVADACTLVDDLYACHLPQSSIPVSDSTAAAWMLSANLLGVALTVALTAHVLASPAALTFIFILLLATKAAAAAGTATSILLPELVVNVSTTALFTMTETVYVANAAFMPTTTLTQFIAPCTPYCASVDDKGQCLQAQGCKGVVGRQSTATVCDVPVLTIGAMLLASVLLGVWVGRLDDRHMEVTSLPRD
ncbi:hypothetical protein LTR36_008241 [Oleoguttula mirabilis]|uniref:Uncharacterized protein n=1 Tax=Oleoguttula mirabilis TaxID=1507867 RepID=A0AAV9J7X1_9PEZI|nr:hypothetical protein LTR36_008241 [Oleoguttula mirabilis]